MVVWIPADHFQPGRPEPTSWWRSQPLLRGGGLVIKNALGLLMGGLGIVMALPLVPGPGSSSSCSASACSTFRQAESRAQVAWDPQRVRFLNEVRGRSAGRPWSWNLRTARAGRATFDGIRIAELLVSRVDCAHHGETQEGKCSGDCSYGQ